MTTIDQYVRLYKDSPTNASVLYYRLRELLRSPDANRKHIDAIAFVLKFKHGIDDPIGGVRPTFLARTTPEYP